VTDLQKGLYEAFVGAISSFVGIGIINQFVEDGLIPWYLQIIAILFILCLDIVAIEKLDTKGIIYIIGWIIGSLLVINILDALGILLAIVVPILMLIYKFKDKIESFFT
jgi:hypothetical protein